MERFIYLFWLCWIAAAATAQDVEPDSNQIGKIIEGRVLERLSHNPVQNVRVELMYISPIKATLSDSSGYFRLENVPLGLHRLLISCEGFESLVESDIVVSSGRQVYVPIDLDKTLGDSRQNSVSNNKPTLKTTFGSKDKSLNNMSLLGVRLFTINEVERYTGARDDPQRLVANLAGIRTFSDEFTELIVRGQPSYGVRFRVEGIPTHNISHLPNSIGTGGVFPILNQNTLSNSEFLLGGFSAEYGNASSGIFDIKLRQGNPNHLQFTGQVSITALETTLEGPISKRAKSSFMGSFRYAIFPLLNAFGANIITQLPVYRDVHFKLDFPKTKAGSFSIFGVGGNGFLDVKNSPNAARPNYFSHFNWRQGVFGIQHKFFFTRNAYLHTNFGCNIADVSARLDSLDLAQAAHPNVVQARRDVNIHLAPQFNALLSHKHALRTGFLATYTFLNYRSTDTRNGFDPVSARRGFLHGNGYAQVFSKWSNRLNSNIGLSVNYLGFNQQAMLSPRAALRWNLAKSHQLALGYAMMQDPYLWQVYFQRVLGESGAVTTPNQNFRAMQTHQFSLDYLWALSSSWRVRGSGYYYQQNHVAVGTGNIPFVLNNRSSVDWETDPYIGALTDKGKGYARGVELSVEKFFDRQFYGLISSTLFETKYRANDGIWYRGAFDSRYIVTAVAGKEFSMGRARKNAFTVDIRGFYAGGYYYTPIDLNASRAAGYEIFDYSRYLAMQSKTQFRLDLKVGFRINRKRSTHIFFLDGYNILNTSNTSHQRYDYLRQDIHTWANVGRLVFFTYRYRLNLKRG